MTAITNSRWAHRWRIARRITAKAFYRLAGRQNLRWQPEGFFAIKKGYRHAMTAEAFDDTGNKDEWQKEVYQLAAATGTAMQAVSVIDVGCGSGYKLVHLPERFTTTGIEVQPVYDWLRRQYPERAWLLFDETDPATLQADLVICADVIEHMENPDDLLDFLDAIHFKRLVISTPERDGMAGNDDFGPPENTAHYREWNAAELKTYLGGRFRVLEQHIFTNKTVTQVVICQKK